VDTSTIRLHMLGNRHGLTLLSSERVGRPWRAPPQHGPAEFFVHVLDARGGTLDRVPFTIVGTPRSTWIEGIGAISAPDRPLLNLVDVPDHGATMAEIRLEREVDNSMLVIGTVRPADLAAAAAAPVAIGTTKQDVHIAGASDNRFDIAILGAGYLAADQAQFDTDVAQFTQALFATEPFQHYRQYINVRSVFRPATARACLSPQQPIGYGIRFVADGFQTCGTIDPNGFGPGQPLDITAANADGATVGFDPGGLLVFVNSWAIPNQTIYGGLGQIGTVAIATTNRTARPAPFTPFLRFPELPIHELGHAIAGLADETNAAFGSCQGCPPPEPAPATDFVEFNTTRWSDKRRWLSLVSKIPNNLVAGGGLCNGNCTGVCSLTVPCLPPGPGLFWPIFHALPNCMMNLLDAPFCPPCMEELTLALNAGIDAVDNPSPASTAITITLTDQVTFSWQDLTLPASKSGTWFIDNVAQAATAPGTSFSRTGAGLGLGRRFVRVDVADTTQTSTATSSWLVGTARRGQLTGSRTWIVDVVTALPAGPQLLLVPGLQGGFNSQVGRFVTRLGDWNADGTNDIGITTAAGVHAVSGRDGTNLFFVAKSSSGAVPYVGALGDIDLDGRVELLRSEEVPAPQQVRAYDYPGVQTGQWVPSNNVRDLVPLGLVNADSIPDFAACAADRVEVFSGAGGANPLIYGLYPAPNTWVVSLGAFDEGHAMQSLGYDDYDGFGNPDGDITGDGRAEYVLMTEDAHPGIGRAVRLYSGSNPTYLLWQVQLDSIARHWIAACGDVDGNFNADFLVATPSFGGNAGRVQVRSGTDGSLLRTHVGTFGGQQLGRGIAGVGDVDLDGRPDYAIARFGASNQDFVDIRSGATGNLLGSLTNGLFNGRFGFGQAMASVGDINSDGIPDLAIGNWSENNNPGALRVFSPVPRELTSPQATISAASGGSQTFNIDMPNAFAGFGFIMAGSLSGTAIPGVPFQSVRLPIVPDFIFTLGLEQSPFYTNSVGTLDPVSATATASVSVPAAVSSILLGWRMHHIALVFDPANPSVVIEVTNAVFADFQ
jgi:hypothetical protein